MCTIHMLVGIPGSGKSYYAKQLCKSERAVIVATDSIRERLFGSESKQKNTYLVFDALSPRSNRRLRPDEMSF